MCVKSILANMRHIIDKQRIYSGKSPIYIRCNIILSNTFIYKGEKEFFLIIELAAIKKSYRFLNFLVHHDIIFYKWNFFTVLG